MSAEVVSQHPWPCVGVVVLNQEGQVAVRAQGGKLSLPIVKMSGSEDCVAAAKRALTAIGISNPSLRLSGIYSGKDWECEEAAAGLAVGIGFQTRLVQSGSPSLNQGWQWVPLARCLEEVVEGQRTCLKDGSQPSDTIAVN